MDVTKHDPESHSVTVALAWAPGVMGAVPWTWESQGSTRDISFAFFFFFKSRPCSLHLLHVLKKHMQHKEILAIILGD